VSSLPSCRRLFAGALLLALAACRSAPEVALETPYGWVRADTPQRARDLGLLLTELAPRVHTLLPDTHGRPTEVWLDEGLLAGKAGVRAGVVGVTALDAGRIHVRADRLHLDADFILAHELVHAQLGPSWDPLPAVLKEGLCDVVASQLAPGSAVRIRAMRLVDASFSDPEMALELCYSVPGEPARERMTIPISGLDRLDPIDALAMHGGGIEVRDQPGQESAHYGYGMLICERIVDRMGFVGLHQLCVRASAVGHRVVPAAWLLAAAGLDEQASTWRGALVDSLAAPELAAQCEFLARELTGFVLRTFRHRYPGLSGRAFLDRSLPTLGWEGGHAKVAVSVVKGLREGILAGWKISGPRPIHAGDSWWLRDERGVHLTSLLSPSDGEPFYTVSRLGLGNPLAGDGGWMGAGAWPGEMGRAGAGDARVSSLPVDQAEVEAYLQIGMDSRGAWLTSLLPTTFASLQVTLDGVLVADLESGFNTDVSEDTQRWVSVTCRLPGDLVLDGMVLFGDQPNLIVSQRAGPESAVDTRFPLSVPRLP
jgi:hypothetical protein